MLHLRVLGAAWDCTGRTGDLLSGDCSVGSGRCDGHFGVHDWGAGAKAVIADTSVAHLDDPVAGVPDFGVVRDENDRLTVLAVELAEQGENLGGALGV